LAQDRREYRIKDAQVFFVAKRRGHRHVDREACPFAHAYLVERPGARIEGKLMGREIEDRSRIVENVLDAVAVMDVPIDHGHAPKTASLEEPACRDRDVVEQAK